MPATIIHLGHIPKDVPHYSLTLANLDWRPFLPPFGEDKLLSLSQKRRSSIVSPAEKAQIEQQITALHPLVEAKRHLWVEILKLEDSIAALKKDDELSTRLPDLEALYAQKINSYFTHPPIRHAMSFLRGGTATRTLQVY